MDIQKDRMDGFLVLRLGSGSMLLTPRRSRRKSLPIIEGGETRFIVDLSRVDYVSSAGLRVFILASKRLTPTGGKFVLCSLQEPVRQVSIS
jgi:anti-anti-sigma factor